MIRGLLKMHFFFAILKGPSNGMIYNVVFLGQYQVIEVIGASLSKTEDKLSTESISSQERESERLVKSC